MELQKAFKIVFIAIFRAIKAGDLKSAWKLFIDCGKYAKTVCLINQTLKDN